MPYRLVVKLSKYFITLRDKQIYRITVTIMFFNSAAVYMEKNLLKFHNYKKSFCEKSWIFILRTILTVNY